MIARACAKINLTLRVLDKRPDGYHNIDSIMQTISLHDTLEINLTNKPGQIDLSVKMVHESDFKIAADQSNLCYKAAKLFLDATGLKHGVSINLTKLIPSQAGLGGGSSDAAATLKTLNKLTNERLSDDELLRLALGLGADVPFFLVGGTCHVTGIGEAVELVDEAAPIRMLIIKPNSNISTAAAYEAIDQMRENEKTLTNTGAKAQLFYNDFESVIYPAYPEIAGARDFLLNIGCDHTLLCGSGSAVSGFVDSDSYENMKDRHETLHKQALGLQEISSGNWQIYPCRTVNRAYINS